MIYRSFFNYEGHRQQMITNNGGHILLKKIAIIGAGPTGIYTLFSLLKQGEPLDVSIYEQAEEAAWHALYSDEENEGADAGQYRHWKSPIQRAAISTG